MSMITWSTEAFMQKMVGMCNNHIRTLKSHTLGDQRPEKNSVESGSASGGISAF